jgi:hypothetical protein
MGASLLHDASALSWPSAAEDADEEHALTHPSARLHWRDE